MRGSASSIACCKMRGWILEHEFATPEALDEIEKSEEQAVLDARERAWEAYRAPIEAERKTVVSMLEAIDGAQPAAQNRCARWRLRCAATSSPPRRKPCSPPGTRPPGTPPRFANGSRNRKSINRRRYGSHLYSESEESALRVPVVPARYSDNPTILKGFEILSANLDAAFQRFPNLVAFGEDVGHLGGVNQGWAHLQEKYGIQRVSDTGIREATIVGQAIGMALRGLRPMAEIQYLDYLLYALQIIADDLANLRWRTHGGQKAPVIIRTRGHRLEGIWHSGSPMSGIINLVRGLYVCVPRNAVQASGFYNTLLRSDDAALVVEVLNEYRSKEPCRKTSENSRCRLGVPEILRAGKDVTVVTYGACCEIALKAATLLRRLASTSKSSTCRLCFPSTFKA